MEVWNAVEVSKVFEGGRTHPILVECVSPSSKTGASRLYVLKTMGLPDVTESSLFFELFGNLLARKMQVDTPEPALIRLTPEFISSQSCIKMLSAKNIILNSGMGVGCAFYPSGFVTVLEDSALSEKEMHQATRIYAYDMLTQNPDRTFKGGGKPNCSQFDTGLIAYDFELSFSFVRLFALNASAWEVCSNGFYNKHIFHSQLKEGYKNGKVSFEPVIDDLRILDIDRMMTLQDDLPAGWLIYAPKIESHLKNVIQNLSSFENELIRSLA